MKKILLHLIIALFFCEIAFGVGIMAPGNNIVINFEPNLEEVISFGVRSNMDMPQDVILSAGGDLSQYVTLSQERVSLNPGEVKTFSATIKFPESIDTYPGEHTIKISATEVPAPGSGISASASVGTNIKVFFPYPGKYVVTYFEASDVNEGEPVDFAVTIQNLGQDDISGAWASIGVFGPGKGNYDTKLTTLSTEIKPVPNKKTESFSSQLDTAGYKPGEYKAVASIVYDGSSDVKEDFFKIGTLEVKILNYTKEFQKDAINKFSVNVEGMWNNHLPDIYAQIAIKINEENTVYLKTPSSDLAPWATREFITYWDTKDLETGEYDVTITLYYQGKITTETGKVNILAQKRFEMPKLASTTNLLVLIIILFVAIDILWLVRKKGKRK